MSGSGGPTGPGLVSDPNIAGSVTVGGLDLSTKARGGVALEALHWEHYCERIEDIDMPSLDEANFFTGAVGVAVSMAVAVIGVVIGTTDPSPYLIAVFVALLFSSLVLTLVFGLQYRKAKRVLKKSGARIATEMRAIAIAQGATATLSAASVPDHASRDATGLRVVFAAYGVPGKEVDVAGLLNGLVSDDGVLDFIANNATLGPDPAPNEGKTLRVRWISNEIEKASAFDEGTHVVLR